MGNFLALLILSTPALAEEPQVHRDIGYAEPNNERQTLDVYAPKEGKNHPVVFWIHGGGLQRGDKTEVQVKPQAFVDRGFVFISTNYRFVPNVTIKMCSRSAQSLPMTGVSVRIDHGVCLLRLALWLTWHGIGQRQGTSESETAGKEIAAVHGRASWVRGKSSLRSYPDWTQPVKRRGLVLSSHHEPRLGGRNGQELRPRHNTRDASDGQ